ncbi:Fe-S cluster assembly ATPase SufC [Candidatus Woesearchaeota archaeon]|nr:Fe-S cluster assembly ATPase SufC [Candidatus Woesearchaeota archaeon]
MALLEITDLHASIDGKEILKGVNLKIELGSVNALMGPNGSGKSTLANVLMGHPKYQVTRGKILLDGEDITSMAPDERSKKGLFLSFQYPSEIPGVTISNFLRAALNARRPEGNKIPIPEFLRLLEGNLKKLKMDRKFITRYLNQGFSGGEKKRAEILQLLVMDPTLAILDETDSGLDIDALRVVAEGVNMFMGRQKCILIITHYKRILEYVKPDTLHVMIGGKIVLSGKGDLVDHLEEKGYGWIEKDEKS